MPFHATNQTIHAMLSTSTFELYSKGPRIWTRVNGQVVVHKVCWVVWWALLLHKLSIVSQKAFERDEELSLNTSIPRDSGGRCDPFGKPSPR